MSELPSKAVFDCNVFLQALSNPLGPAGRCLQAAFDGRFDLLIDKPLIDELLDVTARLETQRKLRILPGRVAELLTELRLKAVSIDDVPEVFTYQRDPDDAHYINLAIVTGAFLVVSRDRDLLDLVDENNVDGRALRAAYPSMRILTPPQFLQVIEPPAPGATP
jgi:putative PIN family toxin of toxin-antitoxin system